jgi:hypothetical protein
MELGMIQIVTGYEALIQPLFQLASVSFEPEEFRSACKSIGRLLKSNSDDLWHFGAGPKLVLMVSLDVETVGRQGGLGQAVCRPVSVRFAVLSFCGWETCNPRDHWTRKSYQTEREQFDQVFADALERTIEELGKPLVQGQDTDNQAHHWAIWRGRTGLFVLQQSAYDPQFGLDINYWICPWSEQNLRPSSPLIDWLFRGR